MLKNELNATVNRESNNEKCNKATASFFFIKSPYLHFRILKTVEAECCFNYYKDGYECKGMIHLIFFFKLTLHLF